MYHRIVAAKVRSIFAAISAGDTETMVAGMAPDFYYRFYGNNTLSGERRTAAALREWWARIGRLLPQARFQVEDIIVAGWPWHTRVATRMTIHTTTPDSDPYTGDFMQLMTLRWGKVTEVHTLEDTHKLQGLLDRLAAGGVDEAHAAPISDAAVAGAAV